MPRKTSVKGTNRNLSSRILLENRRARFDYEILEKYEAGLVLLGTEVSSLRDRKVNFKDSYLRFLSGELWVVNLHISPYSHGSHFNHEATRSRKILLHKREIQKLKVRMQEKGLSLIPLRLYLKSSRIKLEFGLCKGKKLYQKRETIRQRDAEKDLKRIEKLYR